MAFTAETSARVPAPHVQVADTVGAGDAFTAALLHALQRGGYLTAAALRALPRDVLSDMLRFAARVGSLTCTRAGAEPPWLDEVSDSLP